MTTQNDYDPELSPEQLTALNELQRRAVEKPMGANPQPQRQQHQAESHRVEHRAEVRVGLTDQELAARIEAILTGPDQEQADRLRALLKKGGVKSDTEQRTPGDDSYD